MQSTRLVYRNHLLPPLQLPFNSPTAYLKTVHPQQLDQFKHSLPSQKQRLLNLIKKQMIPLNQTLNNHITQYRNRWIQPLKKCPWYYQQISKYIVTRKNTQRWNKYSHQYIHSQLTIRDKKRCQKAFTQQYDLFKNNPDHQQLLSHAIFVPTFILAGLSDAAALSKKKQKYDEMSDGEQEEVRLEYYRQIQKYNHEMNRIAEQGSISRKELLQLLKQQFQDIYEGNLATMLFT